MPKHRNSAIAATALLIVIHAALLVAGYGTPLASLWQPPQSFW